MLISYLSLTCYVSIIALIYIISKLKNPTLNKDPFSPSNLFLLLLCAEIPFLITAIANPHEAIDSRALPEGDIHKLFVQFITIKALFAISYATTTSLSSIKAKPQTQNVAQTNKSCGRLALPYLILGVAFTYALLYKVGGLELMLLNWSNKTEMVKGTAFLRVGMIIFFALSASCFAINISNNKTTTRSLNYLLFATTLLIGFVSLGLFGERKNPILLLMVGAISINYYHKKQYFLSPKYLVLSVFLIIFASIAPILRNPKGVSLVENKQYSELLIKMTGNFGQLFERFSDLPTTLYIIEKTNKGEGTWLYKTTPDFIGGFIPTSINPNKAPIDEGVYIYNMANQHEVEIGQPFNNMIPIGWPLSRSNGPFLHISYPGVILGGIFSALTSIFFYRILLKTWDPVWLYIYILINLTFFGLTNAHLFNLIITLILVSPFLLIHKALRHHDTRKLIKSNRSRPREHQPNTDQGVVQNEGKLRIYSYTEPK